MRRRIVSTILLFGLVFAAFMLFTLMARAAIDSNAAVVYLRKSCMEGSMQVNNCFTNMADLQNWIPTRNPQPGPTSPLLIQIGPGSYDPFNCSNLSNVSLRGAGRDQTTIAAMIVLNCYDLNVQDLTVTNTNILTAIYWTGGGSSTWNNVYVSGTQYGWTESPSGCPSNPAVHRWFSSTIQAGKKTAFWVGCSQNWFYGGEIIAQGPGGNGLRAITAYSATYHPEVHVYGSVIRVIPNAGATFSTPGSGSPAGEGAGLVAVVAGQNAMIHLHGTGIDVIGNDMPNDVAALIAANGGMIHATGDGFMLQTPAPGKTYRIKNEGGAVMAPYLWENDVLGMPLFTENGKDMTVENQGTQPHLLIYSNNCSTSGPWFDIGTGKCRGQ